MIETGPHWTPDGEYVSFTSFRGDGVTGALWRKRADGTGSAELVLVTRLNVALEGRYRIERQLGEGGMAPVYLLIPQGRSLEAP